MREEPYSIKEAAELLDVADKTIRRMLARGELVEQTRDEQGRILITVASVEAHRQVSRQTSNPVEVLLPVALDTTPDTESNPIVQTLLTALDQQSARVAELGERAGRAEERVRQLEAELDRLGQASRQVSWLRRRLAAWLLGRTDA